MKKCSKCGNMQEDNTHFCTACGSSDFVEVPIQYNGQQRDKEKKKAVGITSGAIVAMLITAIPFGIRQGIYEYNKEQREKEQMSEFVESIKAIDDVLYTSGEIVDGKYINKWADIQFEVPEKFPLYDNYKENDNETTETGYACLETEKGKIFTLTFYDFTDVTDSFDEDMVLDKRVEEFIEKADENADYVIGDKYTCTIANKDYRAVGISNQDNGYVMRYCVHIKNKRIIEFAFVCDNTEDIDEFLNRIEAVDYESLNQ